MESVARRYTVRLYRVHDYDLISLMLMHNFDIRKAIYISLTNFCKSKRVVFRIPPQIYQKPEDMNWVYTMTIYIDSEKDEDIVRLMNMIQPGCRNSFLKGLLRLYICDPAPDIFMESPSDAKEMGKRLVRVFHNNDNIRIIDMEEMLLSKSERTKVLHQSQPKKPEQCSEIEEDQNDYSETESSITGNIEEKQSAGGTDDLMDLFSEMTK